MHTPITSKDVAFSWSVGVKPESGFARPDVFQRITKIETVDAKNLCCT
jgi:peptide/nickel transport system substrate-binding protein